MTDAKTCPVCAETYTRPRTCSRWNWSRRKFCSYECRNRATVLARRKTGCPITVAQGRCGKPIARWGWCEKHAGDHVRLCPGGCEVCR
jgi:hypothetical protein